MAEKIRNVNLEEIDADTLLGIDALKNQTLGQKVIFWGMLAGGIAENVLVGFFTDLPGIIPVMIFILMLMIGIAFGCNYTEDMTYGKYLYYFFFKPAKDLRYSSTEDIEWIRKAGEEIRREDEKKLMIQKQADEKEQRKLLIKVIVFIILLFVLIAGLYIWKLTGQGNGNHHTVTIGFAVLKRMAAYG